MFWHKKTLVTHDQGFHADDVFAVATLELVFGSLSVERTRDEKAIMKADFVVDVGRVYDEEKNRFDHHQEGGAGVRENTIPFASFGLVWKAYGQKLCGLKEVSEIVDRKLVCAIDAIDNGVNLTAPVFVNVSDYSVSSVIGALNPTEFEAKEYDALFKKAVSIAKLILSREIAGAKALISLKEVFTKAVEESVDKRFVLLQEEISRNIWQNFTSDFPELLFVIVPRGNTFSLRAIRKNPLSFENRKDLPSSWAGKSNEDLESVTGVKGATFCHNKRFVATASNKEAIMKLLEIALVA